MNGTHKINFIALFFSACISITSYSQSDSIAQKIKYYNNKVAKYLDKRKALSQFYAINEQGVSIYSSAQNKAANRPEFTVKWSDVEKLKALLKTYDNDQVLKLYRSGKLTIDGLSANNSKTVTAKNITTIKKLQGLKIALDPGHTAGDMETGQIESKCLKFQYTGPTGEKCNIAISEGMLTFATATLLKNKLEAEGAEVFMTRPFNGSTAYGKTFNDWLKPANIDSLFTIGELSQKQKAILLNPKISKKEKFQSIFKNLELHKRAEIINNYKPDLTVIIHFNVDEKNTGWTKPGTKNYNMTFVGGAFMANDLSLPTTRFEFLHLLISDDLENSVALSSAVLKSFEKNLNVKTASYSDAKYLVEGCLPADERGVYCRNLQLTRYIHSPLVYGETLYQDNINECVLLNEESDKTKNKRIQQIANAYFQGILNYVSTR